MINLSIISAENKKQENEIYWLEKRLKEEIEYSAKVEKTLCAVWEIIKREIETSHIRFIKILITYSEMFELTNIKNWYIYFNPVCEIVKTLLTEAGYEYEFFHEYSSQWQKKSGEYGYFYVCVK